MAARPMSFSPKSISRDNICVLWIDDMIDVFTWRDAFGLTIQTPNIDRLLSRGVRFSNGLDPNPCLHS